MSVFKVSKQGGMLIARDANNRIVSTTRPVERPTVEIKTWKKQLRELTETEHGNILLVKMVNIAAGAPQRTVLDDGTYTEWVVPTISEQRQAAQFLLEMGYGKAVPQTEVVKAEIESEDLEQYRAIPTKDLIEHLRPMLERGEEVVIEAESSSDDT